MPSAGLFLYLPPWSRPGGQANASAGPLRRDAKAGRPNGSAQNVSANGHRDKTMTIKIPPYPDYGITEQAFENDVLAKSEVRTDTEGLKSNKLFLTTVFESGKKSVTRARAVRHNGELYVTAFPNPIHLFLSVGIEHFERSEVIKSTNFPKCGKKCGTNIYVLDIEENGTHDCYNSYIKYRASSIIMLVSALEAFLNHVIPNDFIYKTTRNKKPTQFDKTQIESAKVSFREKLLDVIPQWLDRPTFWDNLINEKDLILALYENRKNIIHLKTNAEDDFERYFDAMDKMLDFDVCTSIKATTTFMNAVSKDFVTTDKD